MFNEPKVLLIGGPDVDARLPIMHCLKDTFSISALGSEPSLYSKFADEGFAYDAYHLSRRANLAVDLYGVAELASILRQLKPDIVHTFATKPSVWGRLAAKLANVPIIVGTIPGLGSLYSTNSVKARTMRSIYQPLQQLACHLSDVTVFQNHDDARQFTAEGVVSGDKALVIPGSGVDTNFFNQSRISKLERQRFKAELGIQPDEVVITMISRVNRSKGVLEFMEAAQAINQHEQKLCFLLVGPNDVGSVDQLSDEELRRLQQDVTWPGTRNDIPTVLASTDIFVLPSAYREGIPRVLLEAASMGLPIITSDAPGCNEVVKNSVNGFLIPARSSSALSRAILDLIKTPQLRQEFGEISRKRAVELFELSVIAEQTASLYQELLARKALSLTKVT